MTKKIIEFHGKKYGFLSNFAGSPFNYDGKSWPTVEHAFQAHKTIDVLERYEIRTAPSPGDAKFLGRGATLRPRWNNMKRDLMRLLVRLKFQHNPILAERLVETNDAEIVEGNTWHDNIWGDCYCAMCKNIQGQNWLGKILMEVRQELVNSKLNKHDKKTMHDFIEKLGDFADETEEFLDKIEEHRIKSDPTYQLIEIEIEGNFKKESAFRIAAQVLWRNYDESEWRVARMMKKKDVVLSLSPTSKQTKVIFEIVKKEEVNEQ